MTTMVGNEAVQMNVDITAGQGIVTAQEPFTDNQSNKAFDYRQFSKAMNRSRYLDEMARGH
jgi:uncharacterized Fe-S cluster-containing MiaB family protein